MLKGPKVAYPTAEEYVHYSYLLFCNFQTMPVSMPFHPLDFVRYSSTVHYWISQVCHYLFAVVYCVRIWAISKLRYFIYIPKCFYLSGIEEFQMFYCLYVEALLKSCKKWIYEKGGYVGSQENWKWHKVYALCKLGHSH